ncbi:T9SS type A sorting domain-containing protein [Candidatus Fermentibacteria bacterium]|nr:T9SS type A sorting domain-containing protein [Candidatus Fermentibacteria bacterium]
MTGLAMVGSTTYASNTYSSYEGCYDLAFSSTSSGYSSMSTYIDDYAGTPTGYDIGYEQGTDGSGDIWMAIDNATSPVRCYEASTGGGVEGIEAGIGIGPDIRGVCFEGTSSQYLWVSNQTTDELYRIDLSTGTSSGSTSPVEPLGLAVGQNPFSASTTVGLTGFAGSALVEVFDMCGRTVHSERVEGSFVLDGSSISSGLYVVRATDSGGRNAKASIVKL